MGISDQSLLRDFSAAGGRAAGDKIIDLEAAGQDKLKEGGREEDESPLKTPQLELTQDGKVCLTFTPKLFIHGMCVSMCGYLVSISSECHTEHYIKILKANCQVLSMCLT